METNEIMNTETVEITENVREIGALGTGLIIGGAFALGAAASTGWKFAKRKFAELKAKKQAKSKEIEVAENVE